jgi:hypothetical protein
MSYCSTRLLLGNVFNDPLPSNGHGADHIENTSCSIFSIVACAYFGRCLDMGLHVTVLWLVCMKDRLPLQSSLLEIWNKHVIFSQAIIRPTFTAVTGGVCLPRGLAASLDTVYDRIYSADRFLSETRYSASLSERDISLLWAVYREENIVWQWGEERALNCWT